MKYNAIFLSFTLFVTLLASCTKQQETQSDASAADTLTSVIKEAADGLTASAAEAEYNESTLVEADDPSNFKRVFAGHLERKDGVSILISMYLEAENGNLSGKYFYEGTAAKEDIFLKGTLEADSVKLAEFDSANKLTGKFTGKLVAPDVIEGIWSSPNGKKHFPFKLNLDNMEYDQRKIIGVKADPEVEEEMSLGFPNEQDNIAKVLVTGTFHEDEVWQRADKEEWFGLFKQQNKYVFKKTSIQTARVKDEIIDSDNQKTGWVVSTPEADGECIVLLAGLKNLTEGKAQAVDLPKNRIFPGETVAVELNQVSYKLYAEGFKIKNDEQEYQVTDYKLLITAAPKENVQLLVAKPDFDDQMITVLWAGDLDGDNKLDLIIDTSRHYNATHVSVYLSSQARTKEFVRYIGMHTAVGC